MEKGPNERDFDLICDALTKIDRIPRWDRMDNHKKSRMTLGQADVLYALHVLKHDGQYVDLFNMGFGFRTEGKNGDYLITDWPKWMVGEFIWDFSQGGLYFGDKRLSD